MRGSLLKLKRYANFAKICALTVEVPSEILSSTLA